MAKNSKYYLLFLSSLIIETSIHITSLAMLTRFANDSYVVSVRVANRSGKIESRVFLAFVVYSARPRIVLLWLPDLSAGLNDPLSLLAGSVLHSQQQLRNFLCVFNKEEGLCITHTKSEYKVFVSDEHHCQSGATHTMIEALLFQHCLLE